MHKIFNYSWSIWYHKEPYSLWWLDTCYRIITYDFTYILDSIVISELSFNCYGIFRKEISDHGSVVEHVIKLITW